MFGRQCEGLSARACRVDLIATAAQDAGGDLKDG